MIAFFVRGVPVAQGSKVGYVVGKRAVIADANRQVLKPWRATIAAAAAEAGKGFQYDEAVWLRVGFLFPRPPSVKRLWPSVKPDADKALRALMDGLVDGGILRDDALVVDVQVTKRYALNPGAVVELGSMREKRSLS